MLVSGWLVTQMLAHKEPNFLHNIFGFGALVTCSVGTLNGPLSLVLTHWLSSYRRST